MKGGRLSEALPRRKKLVSKLSLPPLSIASHFTCSPREPFLSALNRVAGNSRNSVDSLTSTVIDREESASDGRGAGWRSGPSNYNPQHRRWRCTRDHTRNYSWTTRIMPTGLLSFQNVTKFAVPWPLGLWKSLAIARVRDLQICWTCNFISALASLVT
jgi:hypothetical protein